MMYTGTDKPLVCHECHKINRHRVSSCQHAVDLHKYAFDLGKYSIKVLDDVSLTVLWETVMEINDYIYMASDDVEYDEGYVDCVTLHFDGNVVTLKYGDIELWNSDSDNRDEVLNDRQIYVPISIREHIRDCLIRVHRSKVSVDFLSLWKEA